MSKDHQGCRVLWQSQQSWSEGGFAEQFRHRGRRGGSGGVPEMGPTSQVPHKPLRSYQLVSPVRSPLSLGEVVWLIFDQRQHFQFKAASCEVRSKTLPCEILTKEKMRIKISKQTWKIKPLSGKHLHTLGTNFKFYESLQSWPFALRAWCPSSL